MVQKGIGFGIAKRFLEEKYSIVLLDKDEKAIDAIQDLTLQNNCLILQCDVSSPDQVETSISKVIAHFGRIDVLINNAGIAIFKEALKITYQDGLILWLLI